MENGRSPVAQSLSQQPLPPVAPFPFTFEYWPESFVQWIGSDLPYSLIEVYADRASPPGKFEVALIDRASSRRTVYSNDQSLVNKAKIKGDEAYFTPISLKAPQNSSKGSTYEFSFRSKDDQPIIWRLVQASDVTEQGAGLSEIPNSPNLLLIYRESGSVAGEGTAIQVGSTVSAADLWKAISSPPYFIAYRGGHSVGVDLGSLASGDETWKVVAYPASLAKGQEWSLKDIQGHEMKIHIETAQGDSYQMATQCESHPSVRQEISVRRNRDGWLLDKVLYKTIEHAEAHHLVLKFQPAIALGTAATTKTSRFDVFMGKNTRVATGVISSNGASMQQKYNWQFRSPDWAKKRIVDCAVSTGSDTFKVTTTVK